LAALVLAGVLIAVGGLAVARADWAALPGGRRNLQERVWVILPVVFVLTLLVFAAREALR
jgi:hypothetical protein